MIKVLVDHLSYISFVKDFQIKWSVFAITFFTVGDNYINPCPKEMFTFECFLKHDLEPLDKFVDNSILVSFTPLFNGAVCIVFLLIFEFISKKKAKKENSYKLGEELLTTNNDNNIFTETNNIEEEKNSTVLKNITII